MAIAARSTLRSALTFREKLVRLEQMSEVQARLADAVRHGPRAGRRVDPPTTDR
jgi:hypothetical protein